MTRIITKTQQLQEYECGKCGLRSSVVFTGEDNVVSMCIKIAANHNINSPGCKDWEGQIALINSESQEVL